MSAERNDNSAGESVKAIGEVVEASFKACFVLARAPFQIYAECLKIVARTVNDLADTMSSDEDSAQQ